MSVSAMTTRAGVTGLLLCLWFVSACASYEADRAYAEGQKAVAQRNNGRAVEYFSKAIELNPDHTEARLGRAIIYWQLNRYEAALPDLNRAVEIQPDLIWAYYVRGACLISLHRYEEGIDDFATVTASDALATEDLVRAHRWHGIGLLNLERYDEAIVDFTRCVELEPDNPFHYVERGRVYQETGQIELARADYEAYLALEQAENDLTQEVRERLAALDGATTR